MLQAEPFEKNNFDLLWHCIRYTTKSTPYKIKILTVVVYFYSFPAYYLKNCKHWVFKTFNYLSNKAHLNLLSFVVGLQQSIKHINPQLQPCHLNVSFLTYRCIKSCLLTYHIIFRNFCTHCWNITSANISKFYFTFQNIFSAGNVRNNS